MALIRHFETRAEAAYQNGHIGGFFHSYIGQEAIQTACVAACSEKNIWITSYRCHALALLLGASPESLMAELFGKATGNAKGRGGSMHFYTERMLGGFGIVGGQLPIAIGAAFSLKYRSIKDEIAICFLGDGAVAQGTFHESLNLAALWDLPVLFIIENNEWGMGTNVSNAVSVPRLAEDKAASFGIEGYTLDGMDFFSLYENFHTFHQQILSNNRPILVEVKTQRFKGHSISDPGLYRSKDSLKECMEKDPIKIYKAELLTKNLVTAERLDELDAKAKKQVLEALAFAEKSPWPDPDLLEKDVFKEENIAQ